MSTPEQRPFPIAYPYRDGFRMLERDYLRVGIAPSDINEHMGTLATLAAGCNRVAEFGVRTAISTTALLYGLADRLRVGYARVVTYAGYDLVITSEALRVMGLGQGAGVGTTLTHADTFTFVLPTAVDLLFIDTLHTANQLSRELVNNMDRVNRHIVLHDTETFGEHGEIPGTKGLNYAVADFIKTNSEWYVEKTYPNNNGLTILTRRDQTTHDITGFEAPGKQAEDATPVPDRI